MLNYTGDLSRVEWGTKDGNINALDVTLFIIDANGKHAPNVSQYNGRCSGSWNPQSPGQVILTLNPIKEVDNRVFIFRFISNNPLASDVFDTVQLIVKGKNFYFVMNCYNMEGSMKFQNGQVMPLNFNNFEGKLLQCTHERRISGFALNPLTLKSDWHLISPYHITPESNTMVRRINELIT